ncbi:MAG: endolytic transglycosylase MltG [Hydrotalea flava]|uniref:endolytic transglycosylase MltG n=1 Tax=Hydrotalea TaxID=1004300 RepID=UPI0009429043|nr:MULTISPECIES: endolytic transglycosylase MltG [Hydrotalea]NIM34406.1 endolytic transglycosylase MltG [Hydrotalea flava]NIM37232.1 endolytic transglycosylase MltG [Hydrotalea flava]NIN02425.1 endolytic transglycosylase MltG [Hydrotalea flava]NIN14077.1 endolytic transglycosylase MltG [Hydrotalea flava]NIO93158.1 endolytic transglycosylase MltG [Hydrotalea flava]
MRKIIGTVVVLIVIITIGFLWFLESPATAFNDKKTYFTLSDNSLSSQQITQSLKQQQIIKYGWPFQFVLKELHIAKHIKPGKYEVNKDASLLSIIRMLKNNRQASINLVITKLRVKEDLAKLIAKNFSTDSVQVMQFLNSNDSLKEYHVDTATIFTIILPDTYTFYWNTSIRKIFNKLYIADSLFWTKNNRLQKTKEIGLTPTEVYILASIVEEESNIDDERGKIASVYLNRLHQNMALQACPTIKYAMKDFALTRIYEKYLLTPSPYNTYRNKGLPPGPICTPSTKCIDIVLNAPKTNYLYFVAKSDFSGYSHFSSNFAEHNAYAKQYQQALDAAMAKKQKMKGE